MAEPKFVLGDEMLERAARALEDGCGDGRDWDDLARSVIEAAFQGVPMANYGIGLCLQFFDLVICVKDGGLQSSAGVYVKNGEPDGFDDVGSHLDIGWSEKGGRHISRVAAGNQRRELGRARKAASKGKPAPTMRYQNDGDPKTSGPGFGFTVHWDKLEHPERCPAGARVFVNSMSDVFHEEASDDAIGRLFAAAAAQPAASFLILTKRPERMHDVVRASSWEWSEDFARGLGRLNHSGWPLPNVWLGVTIENRRFVHRADLLRQTPATVRFVSAEPLLGPLVPHTSYSEAGYGAMWWARDQLVNRDERGLDLTAIDWLIAGGESGPRHRQIDERWVRDLRDAALRGDTAFFFKQWGGRTPKAGGRELDGRTWDEFPARACEAVSA